jgi:hypothetical protein
LEAFTIEIPEETLVDLRDRLERARWPELFALEDVESLVDRWRDGFDWRAREAELNASRNFARIDDTLLHFVHVRGGGIPILLVHGARREVHLLRRVGQSKRNSSARAGAMTAKGRRQRSATMRRSGVSS